MSFVKDVNKAASLLGRKSAEARKKKWGKKEFVRKMQEWGKLGGRPKGSGKENRRRGEIVGIYKRGEVYWYKFMWQGRSVRESTKQGNDKVARQMEAAHKTSLAKGEVGIREKRPVPTLREFCDTRVEPWAKATFEHTCENNWFWFRAGIRRLRGCESLAKSRLDEITNEKVAGFAAYEQSRLQNRGRGEEENKRGLAVSSINSSIRVLRRILNLAVEWGLVESAPRLALLPGEHHRERVVTPDEEARYLGSRLSPAR